MSSKQPPKQIPQAQYRGPVFIDNESFPGSNGGYFPNVRDLVTSIVHHNLAVPDAILACDVRGPATPDASEYIRRELEEQEFFDGAHENVTAERTEQLQALLDLWWSNCGVEGWFATEDHVVLSPELLTFIEEKRQHHAALPPESRWAAVEGLDAFCPVEAKS